MIWFRVDSSTEIASGHLMRCLALAGAFRENGEKVTFISRGLPGHLMGRIEEESFELRVLPSPSSASPQPTPPPYHAAWLGVTWQQDAAETGAILAKESSLGDILVVDHYALDARWETSISSSISTIFVIDDLEDRPHSCQFLLNQNFGDSQSSEKKDSVRELRGPSYALLRPEFSLARKQLQPNRGEIRRINIFFGGTDPSNETSKAISALLPIIDKNVIIDVILGASNPHAAAIRNQYGRDLSRLKFHTNVSNMAELLAGANLAIGASGTSTWERACLGVPAINTVIAENQKGIAAIAEAKGISINLGEAAKLSEADYAQAFSKVRSNPALRKKMSELGLSLVDGLGTERVIGVLRELKDDYDPIR